MKNLRLWILLKLQGLVSYLNLFIDSDELTRINVKRDDYSFPIVNLPFSNSNIPTILVYAVFIFQLIHYMLPHFQIVRNSDTRVRA